MKKINRSEMDLADRLRVNKEILMLEAADEIDRLWAEIERLQGEIEWRKLSKEAYSEVRAAIQRIDGINDNPAVFNPEINEVCNGILRAGAPATPDDAPRVLTRDNPTGRRIT
jgi:hypothetical protein